MSKIFSQSFKIWSAVARLKSPVTHCAHLLLERAGKGQLLSFTDRREFLVSKAVNEGSEGFKVLSLVAPAANWPSRRKNIETDTMPSEMPAKMFKLMLPVSFGKVCQRESDLLDDLVECGHCRKNHFGGQNFSTRKRLAITSVETPNLGAMCVAM
jgi:hypothetical protein